MAGVKHEGLALAGGPGCRRAADGRETVAPTKHEGVTEMTFADGGESRLGRRGRAKSPGIKKPAGDGAGFSVTGTGAYWLVMRVT